MHKRPAIFSWAYFLFLALLMACSSRQSSETIEKHLADNPEIRKKYLYQSVIRLANVKHDPDYDMLIRDLRKIVIYLPPSEDSTYQIRELRTGLREEGYEQLIDVKTANAERISLWVDETRGKPHYVGLLDSGNEDFIFEIDGQINLEYLSSIQIADQQSLRDLLN